MPDAVPLFASGLTLSFYAVALVATAWRHERAAQWFFACALVWTFVFLSFAAIISILP